jgi:hypothetical protein
MAEVENGANYSLTTLCLDSLKTFHHTHCSKKCIILLMYMKALQAWHPLWRSCIKGLEWVGSKGWTKELKMTDFVHAVSFISWEPAWWLTVLFFFFLQLAGVLLSMLSVNSSENVQSVSLNESHWYRKSSNRSQGSISKLAFWPGWFSIVKHPGLWRKHASIRDLLENMGYSFSQIDAM